MSSGEADAIRVAPPETPPVPVMERASYPPFSMGGLGFRSAARFMEWQKRERGYILRCGHCKNLIEETWGPGGMQLYRHIEGTTANCPEVLPFQATR